MRVLVVVATLGVVTLGGSLSASAQVEVDKDPCILLTPNEIGTALGVADADGKGADASLGVNHICAYTAANGATVQVASKFASDGGKALKQLCKDAKTRTDYQAVKKVGTTACYYRQSLLAAGPELPTLLTFTPQARSTSAGWMIQMRIVTTADGLTPLLPKALPGFTTLGQSVGKYVKDHTIKTN